MAIDEKVLKTFFFFFVIAISIFQSLECHDFWN